MSTPLTLGQILKQTQLQISSALKLPASEAKLEAQILFQHCLNVNRVWLLTHENDELEPGMFTQFDALLKRRLAGEPIAYILGKREFYGMEFKVTPDTLIPRPDTETLVEAALAKIPAQSSFRRKPESSSIDSLDSRLCGNDLFRVLDLGTGTGAIAIAIARHRPDAQVTAVDASTAALAVAQENAKNLGASNVQFILSDWFNALGGETFDVIVSNPPYIAANDTHLSEGDLRFEPQGALAAGTDGLDCIRQIIHQASQHLEPQGWLMLEHGYDQAEQVADLMNEANFSSVSSIADLSGILRVTVCQTLP